jgi:hypothetical protein
MIEIFEDDIVITADRVRLDQAATALERGMVVLFAREQFQLQPSERNLIAQGVAGGAAKNISYDPATESVKGTEAPAPERQTLAAMMRRYSDFTEALVLAIAPGYRAGLRRGRTSFRPNQIAGRETSWRKDDRRRHVDAFPSTPTGGDRILRVFTNVDQHGTERRWRVGPDFETYAKSFLPQVSSLLPGAAALFAAVGITKARRSLYDQMMLGLHDAAKRDIKWQKTAPAEEIAFAPGQSWMVFTDQVPHAALSGCNALEQSFYIDPSALISPALAPLAILARLTGKDVTRRLF